MLISKNILNKIRNIDCLERLVVMCALCVVMLLVQQQPLLSN